MKRLSNILLILALALGTFITVSAQGNTPDGSDTGVIVHTSKPYAKVISAIENLGGEVTIQYENVGALAAQVPAGKLGELSQIKGVDYIEKDVMVELPSPDEDSLSAHPMDMEGVEFLTEEDLVDGGVDSPELYYSYLSGVTGAEDTWAETGKGENSLVAVIDTGTAPDGFCLPSDRVIEGPDFTQLLDPPDPIVGSTNPDNNYHGTFVGNLIAANCSIVLPQGPLANIFTTHLPSDTFFKFNHPEYGPIVVIPLFGMAPESSIYAVKVFPSSGAGTPTSIIEQALDHVITQKKSGALDIDVVNMSLGGASLADGRTLEEKLVDEATEAGMTVAVASGNEGPAPNSVARPGTAYSALTVGAATDTVHTRIYWDFLGLLPPADGGFGTGPGQGELMYPTDELRVSDFSSRGPTADGRDAPDVSATGVFNFALFTPPACSGSSFCFGWGSGTSFSTPTVAGGAALLNSWAESNDPSVGPRKIRNAIIEGAVPFPGFEEVDQGDGYLNVPNALDLLQSGGVSNGLPHDGPGRLKPTVLKGNKKSVTESVTLAPGRTYDWILEISENTKSVEVNVDVDGPIDPGPGALSNSFELYIKSAKRGGAPYILDTANVFDDTTVLIEDGKVTLSGGFSLDVPPNEWPMEPGLMKVTLESDWTNNASALNATVTISRTEGPKENKAGGTTRTIGNGEFQAFAVDIPAGTSAATFELSWNHDWSKFPTSDLDLLFVSPSGFEPIFGAATLNSPERVTIQNPEAGEWLVLVNGYEILNGRDPYVLDMTLK